MGRSSEAFTDRSINAQETLVRAKVLTVLCSVISHMCCGRSVRKVFGRQTSCLALEYFQACRASKLTHFTHRGEDANRPLSRTHLHGLHPSGARPLLGHVPWLWPVVCHSLRRGGQREGARERYEEHVAADRRRNETRVRNGESGCGRKETPCDFWNGCKRWQSDSENPLHGPARRSGQTCRGRSECCSSTVRTKKLKNKIK